MIQSIIGDPVFLGVSFVLVGGTLAVLLALRSQVQSHPRVVARATRLVLIFGILGLLGLSGWTGWRASSSQGQQGHLAVASASSPTTASSPSVQPTVEPTLRPSPSPSPTPRLARSITFVLTSFCQAISARDYQTAWSLYASSLQRRHAYATAATAWSQYQSCSIPEQAYDPDALELLTLTLSPGATDQYHFTGETTERFTMGIEAQAWKVTSVCHLIAEGCFPLAWG